MSGQRKQHHSGSFSQQARLMRNAAHADPTTTCWRDGLTLAEHPVGARWTCGHVDDAELYRLHPSPHARWIDGRLCAPECSGCNYKHGAAKGNRMRSHTTTRNW